jgi:hypothetical protein
MNEMRLLTREEILRRLKRLHGEKYKRRPNEITRHDVARWIGITLNLIQKQESGIFPISDNMQVLYSKLFNLMDAGRIAIETCEDGRQKRLVQVPAPEKKIEKNGVRPFIDFNDGSLKFD